MRSEKDKHQCLCAKDINYLQEATICDFCVCKYNHWIPEGYNARIVRYTIHQDKQNKIVTLTLDNRMILVIQDKIHSFVRQDSKVRVAFRRFRVNDFTWMKLLEPLEEAEKKFPYVTNLDCLQDITHRLDPSFKSSLIELVDWLFWCYHGSKQQMNFYLIS